MTRLSVIPRSFAHWGSRGAFGGPRAGKRLCCALLCSIMIPFGAQASDEALAALAERGFLPWASDFVGEFPVQMGPNSKELLLGSGYLIRLPRPTRATQFLVVNGTRSVIVDRIGEVGPVGVSTQAAGALGLLGSNARGSATVQIVALLRRDQLASAPEAQRAERPVAAIPPPTPTPEEKQGVAISLPPLVMVDEALSEPLAPPQRIPVSLPDTNATAAPPDQTEFSLRFEQTEGDFAQLAPGFLEEDEVLSFRARDVPQVARPEIARPEIARPAVQAPPPETAPSVPRIAASPAPPARQAQPAAQSASGRYALQVGFFKVQGNAKRLAGKLRDSGLPVLQDRRSGKAGTGWLVLVGPFATTAERDRTKARAGRLLKDAIPARAPSGS